MSNVEEVIQDTQVPIYNLGVDTSASNLYPRWWHKPIFWKTYTYPKYVTKRANLSAKEIKEL